MAREPVSSTRNHADGPNHRAVARTHQRRLSLWVLCWFALALVIAARIAKGAREIANADLRRFALRLTLALASTIVTLLVADGIVRVAHYLGEDRRPLLVQLQSSRAQAQSSMHDLRVGDIVQRELLERESRRLGFHFLNTYPYFMDYLNRHPNANLRTVFAVSEVDGHPNTLAHSINAEAIFNYLVARQLVPFDKASNHDH